MGSALKRYNCRGKSGRRGSNPRQPAWRADRRDNVARLLSSGSRRAFTDHVRHPNVIKADGHAIWEADGYLLFLSSYPLLLEKARPIGNMFDMTMVPILSQSSRLGFACERGRRNSTRGAARASRWCILHPDSASLRVRLVRETPEPFARHNIFSGNRLHQNKYEKGFS